MRRSKKLSEEDWRAQIIDELSLLVQKINVQELTKRASALKHNVHCEFRRDDSMMGCANYHAQLEFADRDIWLVRIPRRRFSDAPDDLIDYLVASEYATLKFLEPTKVPAPRAFDFGLVSDEEDLVGVSYLLIESFPGKPCDLSSMSEEQKDRIFAQVAEILVEISKHPFAKAGSLISRDDHVEVSKMASNRFVQLGLSGPFGSALEYFQDISEQYLDLIADGQVHHRYPAEAFAFYTLAYNEAGVLASDDVIASDMVPEFFLKHVDDKGDHLLVDERGVITGIIDWQFARVTPANEAFGPYYITADLDSLYSNNTGITAEDKRLASKLRQLSEHGMGYYMDNNELTRRFHHGLGEDCTKEEARKMLEGWRAALRVESTSSLDIWMSELCRKDSRWKKVHELAVSST